MPEREPSVALVFPAKLWPPWKTSGEGRKCSPSRQAVAMQKAAQSLVIPVFLLLTVLSTGCGGSNASTGTPSFPNFSNPTAPEVTVRDLEIRPGSSTIILGKSRQFSAIVSLSDGRQIDVSGLVTWTADPAILQVDANGLATAAGLGATTLVASYGAVSRSVQVTVVHGVVSLALQPPDALSSPGSSRQYRAFATFSDGSSREVTGETNWSSNQPSVQISNDNVGSHKIGLAQLALDAGTGSSANITGTYQGESALATLRLGRYAYSIPGDINGVAAFSVNAAGAFARIGPEISGGRFPGEVKTDPTGRFVYVANNESNNVWEFSIAPDGGLTPLGSSPSSGENTRSIAMDPTGRYLYAANSGSNSLGVYAIGNTGQLTLLNSVTTESGPSTVAIDPSGHWVYVGHYASLNLLTYSIDATTGLLTPVGTPVRAGSANQGSNVLTVDPSGRFLFSAQYQTVSSFSIGADGRLSALQEIASGPVTGGLTVHPGGRLLYACNSANGGVSRYSIADTGQLTFLSQFVESGAHALAIDPTARFAYISHNGGQNLRAMNMLSDGSLTPLASPGDTVNSFYTTLTP